MQACLTASFVRPAAAVRVRLAPALPVRSLHAHARLLSSRCPTLAFVQPARRSSVVVRASAGAGWDPSAEVPAHLKGKDLAGSE